MAGMQLLGVFVTVIELKDPRVSLNDEIVLPHEQGKVNPRYSDITQSRVSIDIPDN
jgi:hypothetical protein